MLSLPDVIASDLVPLRQLTPKQAEVAKQFLIRMSRMSMDPMKRLDKLYAFAEKYLEPAKEKAVCKTGCSHCCHVNVAVTGYEAMYIEHKTGIEATDTSHYRSKDYTGKPCVFLKDNMCSIYEARPMACRAFFTFDSPDLCADDTYPPHLLTALRPPGGGGNEVVNKAYELVVHYNEDNAHKDIRDFFGPANEQR